ncbi:MAG: S8 family serine peptidase [Anaerolineaceae bacterium]|nr:S8 family serine peptidase [Anaerolineaceae bacterium]
MKRNLFKIFAVLMVLAMVVSPASAKEIPGDFSNSNLPSRTPTELPQELVDEFRDGMTIEEFLIRNQGPIPNALLDYAGMKLTVVIQLEKPSLIEYMGKVKSSPETMSASTQQSYVQIIKTSQKPFIDSVEKLGGDVMGQYTKTINGFMAKVPARELNTIRSMPGVKSVSRAPEHELTLSNSVPLINADDVWDMLPVGFKGTGITIAVIDTGIDYTHAMLGGSGNPSQYAANDPTRIEGSTFPTAKVIGGWDFAGTNYDAGSDDPALYTPVPDPDPLDENGHGTHVASTAAGIDAGFGSGVAPEAFLYALKVFGADGSTNLAMDAIEWAMDPNGDGSINDHVDVINMSLGSSFGPNDVNDPELIVVEAASQAGVFVVASAGNSGNNSYIVGAPSVSDSALSVAASSTGFSTSPYIEYNEDQKIPYTVSYNPFETTITAEMVDVSTIEEIATPLGEFCDIAGIAPGALEGKIALIKRGTCSFYVKINNAEELGAVAAIIYNNTTGIISMDTTGSTLPAGSILQSDGTLLKGLTPLVVSVGPDSNVTSFVSPDPPDTIGSFSSRGPRGFDSKLKPEISAPGVAIFAAMMGSGDQGVSYNGTSMAAPHVTGVAALLKQAHPNWTNEQIKASMMNTAVDLADIVSAQVPRQGAGRVDAYAAVNTPVVAVGDPKLVSLSWGVIELEDTLYEDVKTVTLYNFSSEDKTYDVATVFTSDASGATLTSSVSQVVVPASGSVQIDVTLELDPTLVRFAYDNAYYEPLDEYYGFVTFSEVTKNGVNALRVPFYFVPRPYTEITEDDSATTFDIVNGYGYADLTQSGPMASSLWAYPVFMVSDNDPDVLDMGDLHYVGLDYGWYSASYGDIFVPAFSMWGPVHTNQPFFSEVDLYVDADQDGSTETVNFNYNYGWWNPGASNNWWYVIQVDYTDGNLYLGSPYMIYTDFGSGFQEWYLPTSWNYLSSVFDFEVVSYDWNGSSDYAGMASFDLSKPPLGFDLTSMNPNNEPFSFGFWVNDIDGYLYSQPQGVMLVDYYGKPGAGQAYYWDIDPRFITRFPLIFK